MNVTDLHPTVIDLRKGAIHRLGSAHGRRVEALSGHLWITIDHDRRDILVPPGRGFSIDRPGETLISALDDARFVVLDRLAAYGTTGPYP
jgi:hypothetical protein